MNHSALLTILGLVILWSACESQKSSAREEPSAEVVPAQARPEESPGIVKASAGLSDIPLLSAAKPGSQLNLETTLQDSAWSNPGNTLIACSPQYSWNAVTAKCEATPTCSTPFSWNAVNKRCEAVPGCTPPFSWGAQNNPPRSICMTEPICTPPFVWETSTCKADPICTSPFTWNTSAQRCQASKNSSGSCPAGTDLIDQISNVCVQYFECPAGNDKRVDMPYNHFCEQYFECPPGTDMKYNMPYNYFCKDNDFNCPAGTDTKIGDSSPQTCVDNNWICPNAADVHNTSTGKCEVPSTCTDGIKNQSETDVDCGGSCSPCGDNKACQTGGDCVSKSCGAGVCKPATCTDGIRNQDEADVDCAGVCTGCAVGKLCSGHDDCSAKFCYSSHCKLPGPCDLPCVRYTSLCPGSFSVCVSDCNNLSNQARVKSTVCVNKATTCNQADACGLATSL